MTEKRILFGEFIFPIQKGLEYLVNEGVPETDFVLINEPNDSFSITFEKGFPIFAIPEKSNRDYCLLELKREDRMIKIFCPERQKNLDTAVWYFYVDLFDRNGNTHTLPGQVRVAFDGEMLRYSRGKPKFIEVLESVMLATTASV